MLASILFIKIIIIPILLLLLMIMLIEHYRFINHYRGYLLSFLFNVFLLLFWNSSSHEEFLCCNYFEINSTPNWRSKSGHDVRISSSHLSLTPVIGSGMGTQSKQNRSESFFGLSSRIFWERVFFPLG